MLKVSYDDKLFAVLCDSLLVSLEVFSPAQTLFIMQTSAIHHSVFCFSSFSILLYSGIFTNLFLSVPSDLSSFLCYFLLFILSILLFFFTILSVPCSVFCLSVYSLYFLISHCFLFKSTHILSFLFSYYSTQTNI